VQLEHGRAAEAVAHLRKAVELAPRAAEGHCKLGIALARTGRAAEAISQYENALRIAPDYIQARHDLAWILATAPEAALRNGPRAVELALRANELTGGQSPVILGTLAAAYAESGKFAGAIATAQRALELAGGQGNAVLAGVLRSQLALYREGSPVRDPSLAGGNTAPRRP
jgi:tetratricopeptide (TPR) repeat protein